MKKRVPEENFLLLTNCISFSIDYTILAEFLKAVKGETITIVHNFSIFLRRASSQKHLFLRFCKCVFACETSSKIKK